MCSSGNAFFIITTRVLLMNIPYCRYHTWDYLKIDKVVWSVLPSQTLTVLAMISVVGLSSSLDIAAIETELKRPLDYNHELKTVGLVISYLA